MENKLLEEILDENDYDIDVLKKLVKEGKYTQDFIRLYDDILRSTKIADSFVVMQILKEVPGMPIDFNKHLERFLKSKPIIFEDPNRMSAIKNIISSLAEHEKVGLQDISLVGQGHDSQVLKIGNYVFKIGQTRKNYELPYHRRIIQPILRRIVPSQYWKSSVLQQAYIEVQAFADDKWYEGMSENQIEEILYSIYKELRDTRIKVKEYCREVVKTIEWKDVKKENVGRLLRDNIIKYNTDGKVISIQDEGIGITNRNEEKQYLKKGEYVIIDTDYLYFKELNSKIEYTGAKNSLHNKFEERYLNETKSCINDGVKDGTKDCVKSCATDDVKGCIKDKIIEDDWDERY